MNNLLSWVCLRNSIIWKEILLSYDTFKNPIGKKLSKDLFFNEIDQLENIYEFRENVGIESK